MVNDEIVRSATRPTPRGAAGVINSPAGFLSAAVPSKVAGTGDHGKNTTNVAFTASFDKEVKGMLRRIDSNKDPTQQVLDLLKHAGPLQDMVHNIVVLKRKVAHLQDMTPHDANQLRKGIE